MTTQELLRRVLRQERPHFYQQALRLVGRDREARLVLYLSDRRLRRTPAGIWHPSALRPYLSGLVCQVGTTLQSTRGGEIGTICSPRIPAAAAEKGGNVWC